ncbi:MAG: type II toxin-antitoxin system VapC family toxin [Spirochaetales bacterium]|nr:type II toxin-antitoxin system VapC family toxin [Spirochaetales bacterium]
MVGYFDTSALVKRYINEDGTEKVRNLFRNVSSIIVAAITKIELASTLKRALIEKRIEKLEYEKIWERIQNDFIDFKIVKFDNDVEDKAIAIIEKYQMNAMDSIQIASFFIINNEKPLFVCCDAKILDVMKKEGIKIINPLNV